MSNIQFNLDRLAKEGVIFPEAPFDLVRHSIIIGNRGSQAHGTYIPNTHENSIDDIDLMCVTIPPIDYYLGLKTWDMCEGINDPWDIVAYEFKKFVGLLTKQNPNVLALLWLDEEDYYSHNSIGKELINHRDMFSSRESLTTFVGYAKGQLNRMTHVAGRGYLGAKRKALVEKHGYDTKNAGHLIRLLHMGTEFLETGKLHVKRTWDREQLISIKLGNYTLVEINKMAAEAFEKIEEVEKKSPLPKRLDMKALNKFCTDLLCDWFEVPNLTLVKE